LAIPIVRQSNGESLEPAIIWEQHTRLIKEMH